MNDLISKLTSYNLFNYLLPGSVFVVLAEQFTSYSFIQSDVFFAFFVYYFIGLAISRFGSLVIEPLLKLSGFVEFASYKDFVRRCQEDPKIETLSEANNTYRTLLSVVLVVGFLRLASSVARQIGATPAAVGTAFLLTLGVLFLFSYIKQTGYVLKRVKDE